MRKLNWGILGTAEIAQKLTLPAMVRANNAEVVAIASRSGKAKKFADEFSIDTIYNSYDELLADERIDAVYIPLPNHLHKEWTIKAANHKKHILCEKPSSLSAEDTKEMVEVCRKNDVHFSETFMYQYHPQNQRVKQLIDNGEIGDIQHIRSHCAFYLDNTERNFRLDPKTGGGSLYDVGVYSIHTIREIAGSEPTSVMGKAVFNENNVDISSNVILNFDNDIVGSFTCGMNTSRYMAYEIIGTKGIIKIPRAYQPDQFDSIGKIEIFYDDGSEKSETIGGDEQKLAIEHFGACVMDAVTPIFPAQHSVKNMKVLDACLESINKDDNVEVER